jgi:DNA-binding NarL/FixJ family response regulator
MPLVPKSPPVGSAASSWSRSPTTGSAAHPPAGYLLKERIGDTGQLIDALHRVIRGELVIDPDLVRALVTRQRTGDPLQRLTERERAVLALMAEGRSNAGIATRLYLSPKSVERHVAALFDKLGLPPDSDDNRRVLAVITYLRTPA